MYSIGIPKEIKEYERRVSLVPSDITPTEKKNETRLL